MTEITEDVLKNAITSKYVIKAMRDMDEITFSSFFDWPSNQTLKVDQYDLLMELINRGGRFDEYKKFIMNEISWDLTEHNQVKEYEIDVGAVIFMETLLMDVDGDRYIAEPTQFHLMLDPFRDSVKTITRRGSKSFSDRVVAFRNCIAYPGYAVQVAEQSWEVAQDWLREVYIWWYNSDLLKNWSGGTPLLKNADTRVMFQNQSTIFTYTASSLENISGLGVHMQIYDEKSLYSVDTKRAKVTGRGQPKKEGKKHLIVRTSGTPFGSGTGLHDDQVKVDDKGKVAKMQYFAPVVCPMGYEKAVCYNCDYYTLTRYRRGETSNFTSIDCLAELPKDDRGRPDFTDCFKRIPDFRLTYDELLEDYEDLGETLFMQEYMCATQDYSGNAIPLSLIRQITDDRLRKVYKLPFNETVDGYKIDYPADMKCFVGVDFGKSERHRAAYSVVGELSDNIIVNLNTTIFPAGNPYRTRDPSSGDYRKGVVETVIDLFNYFPNIQMIVGDAMGVGIEYVENDLADLCRKHHGFNNVVPYKTVGESKKFGGKSQTWLGKIKPAMEVGRIKTYLDRDLNMQMRAWRMDDTGPRPKLGPPKAGRVQSDDALMAYFMALWGALTVHKTRARSSVPMGAIPQHDAYGISPLERAFSG